MARCSAPSVQEPILAHGDGDGLRAFARIPAGIGKEPFNLLVAVKELNLSYHNLDISLNNMLSGLQSPKLSSVSATHTFCPASRVMALGVGTGLCLVLA